MNIPFAFLKTIFGRYVAIVGLGLLALVLAALTAQTFRLKSSQLDFAHLQATVAQDDTARANASLKSIAQHRDTEQKIQADAAETKKADDEKIRTLAADASRLERLLRNRPTRPVAGAAVVPAPAASAGSSSGSGPGSTGAQLYSEDGAVLVGEASRAQRIRVERDSCIDQYHKAEKRLNAEGSK